MWELRWVLLTMGVLLMVGLYRWHRSPIKFSFRRRRNDDGRVEPSISGLKGSASARAGSTDDAVTAIDASIPSNADKIVTLRFIGRGHSELSSAAVVGALRNAGLVHGRYGIFHALPETRSSIPRFSVASLTEPGSFELEELEAKSISGMSFFMVMPGPDDPVVCFDDMVRTARALSVELDGELFDEQGSSWSIQRERYIREQIIEYRHQRYRS